MEEFETTLEAQENPRLMTLAERAVIALEQIALCMRVQLELQMEDEDKDIVVNNTSEPAVKENSWTWEDVKNEHDDAT